MWGWFLSAGQREGRLAGLAGGAQGDGGRVAGGVVRSRPCGPCPYHRGVDEAFRSGPRVVAGQSGQPLEGQGAAPDGRTAGAGARRDATSTRPCHGSGSAARHPPYRPHPAFLAAPLSRGAVRLADGCGQPGAVPPVGRLALDHEERASGCTGPAGLGRARPSGAGGAVFRRVPYHARTAGPQQSACMGLFRPADGRCVVLGNTGTRRMGLARRAGFRLASAS